MDVKDMRKDYANGQLWEDSLDKDPLTQFRIWFSEALNSEEQEPNGMTLCTVGDSGKPSSRIVLLKEVTSEGFVWYTNYQSRKGQELLDNPQAALLFWWPTLERQVRIEGQVSRFDPDLSTDYFQSRPRGSQIGAWASPQSRVIVDREYLDKQVDDVTQRFQDTDPLPRPDHWGGYLLIPNRLEFWQGRESRLHDRLVYQQEQGHWNRHRLAP